MSKAMTAHDSPWPSGQGSSRAEVRRADAEIASHIREILRQLSSIDSGAIEVVVLNGVVKLRGSVRCWSEWDTVERVAWSAHGVSSVHNHLVIAYEGRQL